MKMPKEARNKVSGKASASRAKHSARGRINEEVVLDNYKRLEHDFIVYARQNSRPVGSNPSSMWNYLPAHLTDSHEGEASLTLFITECLAEVQRLRANIEADLEELDNLKAETRTLISQMLAA